MLKSKIKIMIGLLVVAGYATNYNVNAESKVIVTEFPLTLETNESAIIVSDHFTINYVEKDGITNVVTIAESGSADEPYIITGPIKLFFGQGLLTYRVITNSPFKTMFLRCGETKNIFVDTNQTIRFFGNSTGNEQVNLQVTQGENSLPFYPATEYGTEYDGPLSFDFSYTSMYSCGIIIQSPPNTNCNAFQWNGSSNIMCAYFALDGNGPSCVITNNGCKQYLYNKAFILNYYIIDEFLSIPHNGYVENSPGSLILTVEKSTTLTNWFPAFITSTGDDQHTFYRLKMSRKDAGLTGGGSFLFNGGGSMSYYENWEYPPLPPGLEYIE